MEIMKHRIMALLIMFVSLFFFAIITCDGQGHSQLEIELHPGTIHPILTKKLQLRCSVKNSHWRNQEQSTTVSAEVKTNHALRNDSMELMEDKRSHSKGTPHFSQLLSLFVIKLDKDTGLNETIASVTGCDYPVVEKQFIGGVHVEGSCESSPKHEEQGYISLTWDRPTDDHAGHFVCEALALNSEKHNVSLIASFEITAIEPTISDLVKYISLNDRYIHDLKSTVSQLYEEKEQLRLLTKTLEEGFQNIQQALGDGINGTIEVQSGRVQCGQQTVQFSPAFHNPPKVFISTTTLSGNLRARQYVTISYAVSITSVTSTYFVIVCDMGQLSALTLDWFAIGT